MVISSRGRKREEDVFAGGARPMGGLAVQLAVQPAVQPAVTSPPRGRGSVQNACPAVQRSNHISSPEMVHPSAASPYSKKEAVLHCKIGDHNL